MGGFDSIRSRYFGEEVMGKVKKFKENQQL